MTLKTGDARRMASDDLYAMLEKVIDVNSNLEGVYWILVIVRNSYQGQSANSAVQKVETTEMKLPNKMIHNRIVAPMMRRPLVKQLGTMLWRVDNRIGEVALEYSLPMDVPVLIEDSDNAGRVLPMVAKAATGIPLIHS